MLLPVGKLYSCAVACRLGRSPVRQGVGPILCVCLRAFANPNLSENLTPCTEFVKWLATYWFYVYLFYYKRGFGHICRPKGVGKLYSGIRVTL